MGVLLFFAVQPAHRSEGPFIPRPQGLHAPLRFERSQSNITGNPSNRPQSVEAWTWIWEVSRLPERLLTWVQSAPLIDGNQYKSLKLNAILENGEMQEY
jgi:hypothetical protein